MQVKTVAVVGTFMMDLVARAPRRPLPGETIVGSDFYVSAGGKGFNQAVAAARAGAPTAMIGALGEDDYGRQFLSFLKREGINTEGVLVTKAGTGVGLPVIVNDGGNSIVIVRRANEAVTPAMVCESLDALDDVGVVVGQLELDVLTSMAAAEWAAQNGAIFLLNPAPMRPIPLELLRNTSVITPNEVELEELSRQIFGEILGTEETVSRLSNEFDVSVVATLGSKGALVAERDTPVALIQAPVVRAIDTVGAGDTFCGYLAAGLARGEDVSEAAPRACVAASLSVTRQGSAVSVPHLNELP